MRDPKRRSVIVVEDDSSMSQALERILRLGGHEARIYLSAEAYLENDAKRDAACFIIDLQLPGIGGFELRTRLAPRHVSAPIIFITAFDTLEARKQAQQAGAAAFLVKPFSGRALLESVERALRA
jgi:FixJ family two-component response regulator